MRPANRRAPQDDTQSIDTQLALPRRSLRARLPIVGPTLQDLQRPENRVLEGMIGLAAIGYTLVLVAAAVPTTRGNAWLNVAGGAFLGVGTSVSSTILATRQQTTEGYAKDANLRRKDELYGPLYVEFRQLRDRLAQAHAGVAPYPLWIDVPDQSHPLGQNFFPGYKVYSVGLWPAFKSDHRIDNFTIGAQTAFDAVLKHIRRYNEAVLAVQEPVEMLLAEAIREAAVKVEHSPAYQHWRRETADEHGRLPVELQVVPESTNPQLQLFNALPYGQSYSTPDRPLHHVWSRAWLHNMPIQQPPTLGWLLAARAADAAQFIYESVRPNNPGAVAPMEWYEQIFVSVQNALKGEQAYQAFVHADTECDASLETALRRLNDGLTYIRDRYEGGAPPV